MTTTASLLTYATALAIAAAVPGPGVVALVARALGSGFGPAMAFVAGLVLGDLVYLAAATFGMALVAKAMSEVFVVVRYVAGAYLASLAWRLWRGAERGIDPASAEAERPFASFLAGWAITLANPKTIVFYLALLPALLDLRGVSVADFAILAVVTAAVLLVVMTPYAALASRARGVLREPRLLARLHRAAAAILAGAAVWTVLRRA